VQARTKRRTASWPWRLIDCERAGVRTQSFSHLPSHLASSLTQTCVQVRAGPKPTTCARHDFPALEWLSTLADPLPPSQALRERLTHPWPRLPRPIWLPNSSLIHHPEVTPTPTQRLTHPQITCKTRMGPKIGGLVPLGRVFTFVSSARTTYFSSKFWTLLLYALTLNRLKATHRRA
jgi:hypothetical protein